MSDIVFCTGSGRVTFNNQRSYLKAVCAAFVEIKTPKFTKKVKTCLLHVVSTAAEKSFNSFMLLLVKCQFSKLVCYKLRIVSPSGSD